MSTIEDNRISAARHVLHLQALKKYQLEKHKTGLSMSDVEKLYEEGRVIENPDVEMQENIPSAGPNPDKSFTSQSLSFNGFSDTDSDYIP
jgi:hypothetical protein